jgi:hypothetical protein
VYICFKKVVFALKIQSKRFAVKFAKIGFCIGYYFSWVFWAYLNSTSYNFLDIFINPVLVLDTVSRIFVEGSFKLFNLLNIKGFFLICIWFIEVYLLLFIVYISTDTATIKPFNKKIGKWYGNITNRNCSIVIPSKSLETIKILSEIKHGNLGYIINAKPTPENYKGSHLDITLSISPKSPLIYITIFLYWKGGVNPEGIETGSLCRHMLVPKKFRPYLFFLLLKKEKSTPRTIH